LVSFIQIKQVENKNQLQIMQNGIVSIATRLKEISPVLKHAKRKKNQSVKTSFHLKDLVS